MSACGPVEMGWGGDGVATPFVFFTNNSRTDKPNANKFPAAHPPLQGDDHSSTAVQRQKRVTAILTLGSYAFLPLDGRAGLDRHRKLPAAGSKKGHTTAPAAPAN